MYFSNSTFVTKISLVIFLLTFREVSFAKEGWMIVQVHLNRDFTRKNPLPGSGFEPTTFRPLHYLVRAFAFASNTETPPLDGWSSWFNIDVKMSMLQNTKGRKMDSVC